MPTTRTNVWEIAATPAAFRYYWIKVAPSPEGGPIVIAGNPHPVQNMTMMVTTALAPPIWIGFLLKSRMGSTTYEFEILETPSGTSLTDAEQWLDNPGRADWAQGALHLELLAMRMS